MHYVSLSIHCFPDYLPPEPLSPSLCPSISSLLLILPLGALSIANQPANTHTQPKGFTVRISRLCCYAYTHVVPVTLFTASFCSTCKCVFTVCSSHGHSRSGARRNSKQVFCNIFCNICYLMVIVCDWDTSDHTKDKK